jgi:hypothetical protein
MDRGYDALVYYEYFLNNQEKFVIRATKKRNVCYKGETRNILDVAKLFKVNTVRFQDRKAVTSNAKPNHTSVSAQIS